MIQFQYYPGNIQSNQPLGTVTLDQFIKGHQNPKPETVEVFKQIAEAEVNGDMKLKAELKQNNLYYFTPCVHIDQYRRYANIIQFTGLMVLDFDHLKNPKYSEEFKQFLFHEYDCILVCWLSPSKHGVKALVNIPVVESVTDFKLHFWGIEQEMEQFQGWDGAPQNAVLPLFQSFDSKILFRDDYHTTWEITHLKTNSYNYTGTPTPPPDIDVSDKDKQTVVKIIETGMEAISEPGHPQLRALCIAVGGYAASGYIDRFEAKQLIDHLIESHHYLNKGIAGYQKTASWGLDQGTYKPLLLKKHAS